MNILTKIDKILKESIICANIEKNTAKGSIDIISVPRIVKRKKKNRLTGEIVIVEQEIIDIQLKFLTDKAVDILENLKERFIKKNIVVKIASDGATVSIPSYLSADIIKYLRSMDKHLSFI